jgi:hypothetical protein
MPNYAQIIVMLLALAVVYSAGQGIYKHFRSSTGPGAASNNPPFVNLPSSATPGTTPGAEPHLPPNTITNLIPTSAANPWQSDITAALAASLTDAQAGNITGAEVDADRAATLLQAVRVQAMSAAPTISASPAFFSVADATLERVIQTKPDSDHLAEHARLAEIALAELVSSLAREPAENAATESRVIGRSPRTVIAGTLLNPASLGGNFLDANSMPFSAEILEPPSTRSFADNIRVEDMIFSGAAQTLDGIRWRNVIFINTRLRYEGHEVSLDNVRFIRCTFGFATDPRGARLANAIALSQPSLLIE